MASLTGYMPMPGMAVYAASKAFVLRFTEALAYELRGTRLTVLPSCPAPPALTSTEPRAPRRRGVTFQDPDEVVTTALAALDKKTAAPSSSWPTPPPTTPPR